MTTPESSASHSAEATSGAGRWPQYLVGLGVLVTGVALAYGAIDISSEAGYGGVGPNFLPWMVSIVLMVCGAWITWEAHSGGFRELDTPSGADKAYWPGFIWVAAGLLLNAALITTIGFILSCALCYLLAVQGLRRAAGQAKVNAPGTWVTDFVTGVAISAPVFWLFTKFLAISLPGLTSTGWI
jgi:putative tricarboxylic transport membrane protein